ncbi:hypothetical protein TRIP_B50234 [uncultured Desulfatiglans sp.]|nr:hypothetical protein TRIP_B50234 [uncultured Desulfatiglans sp.]
MLDRSKVVEFVSEENREPDEAVFDILVRPQQVDDSL